MTSLQRDQAPQASMQTAGVPRETVRERVVCEVPGAAVPLLWMWRPSSLNGKRHAKTFTIFIIFYNTFKFFLYSFHFFSILFKAFESFSMAWSRALKLLRSIRRRARGIGRSGSQGQPTLAQAFHPYSKYIKILRDRHFQGSKAVFGQAMAAKGCPRLSHITDKVLRACSQMRRGARPLRCGTARRIQRISKNFKEF